jgi:hypothetical protein
VIVKIVENEIWCSVWAEISAQTEHQIYIFLLLPGLTVFPSNWTKQVKLHQVAGRLGLAVAEGQKGAVKK